nr:lysozyme g-like protein 2 [Taeniopygia guttata]
MGGNILNVDITGALGATVKPDSLSYNERQSHACHVVDEFLPQRRQQKNMEKYQAKMAKAGNGEDLAPAVIDCWYYLSRTGTAMKDSLGDHGNAFGLIQGSRASIPLQCSNVCPSHTCWLCLCHEKCLCPLHRVTKEVNPETEDQNELKQPVSNKELWINSGVSGVLMVLSHFQAGKQYRKTGEPWDTEEHLAQDTEVLYRMINLEKKSPSWTKEQLNGISAYNAGVNTVQTDDKMDIGKTHNYVNDVDSRPRFYKKNGY